jgi:hypothetical protein
MLLHYLVHVIQEVDHVSDMFVDLAVNLLSYAFLSVLEVHLSFIDRLLFPDFPISMQLILQQFLESNIHFLNFADLQLELKVVVFRHDFSDLLCFNKFLWIIYLLRN